MTQYSRTTFNTSWRFRQQVGNIGPPPYRPKDYRLTDNVATNIDARNLNARQVKPEQESLLLNALHEGFVKQLGDNSSFGATLTAELNQTIGTVGSIVTRAFQAAVAVKKLDFRRAASLLGLPYKERVVTKTRRLKGGPGHKPRTLVQRRRVFALPTGREVQKTLANGWLLWSYGVKPLASDVFNALDVLQRPLDYERKVRASGAAPGWYLNQSVVYSEAYSLTQTRRLTVTGSCGATVTVSNPNLWLLSKMGLTNPAQWALEAIPFSFVVDWFSNLSTVVGSFTAYQGYSIRDPWVCKMFRYEGSDIYSWAPSASWLATTFVRSTVLPSPSLTFTYERFRPQRALNAIALLVGFLPRSR